MYSPYNGNGFSYFIQDLKIGESFLFNFALFLVIFIFSLIFGIIVPMVYELLIRSFFYIVLKPCDTIKYNRIYSVNENRKNEKNYTDKVSKSFALSFFSYDNFMNEILESAEGNFFTRILGVDSGVDNVETKQFKRIQRKKREPLKFYENNRTFYSHHDPGKKSYSPNIPLNQNEVNQRNNTKIDIFQNNCDTNRSMVVIKQILDRSMYSDTLKNQQIIIKIIIGAIGTFIFFEYMKVDILTSIISISSISWFMIHTISSLLKKILIRVYLCFVPFVKKYDIHYICGNNVMIVHIGIFNVYGEVIDDELCNLNHLENIHHTDKTNIYPRIRRISYNYKNGDIIVDEKLENGNECIVDFGNIVGYKMDIKQTYNCELDGTPNQNQNAFQNNNNMSDINLRNLKAFNIKKSNTNDLEYDIKNVKGERDINNYNLKALGNGWFEKNFLKSVKIIPLSKFYSTTQEKRYLKTTSFLNYLDSNIL